MLTVPKDILSQFPVRRTRKQKQAFRMSVRSYAESLGYACREEIGSFGCRNLVIGDPESAKFLATAHYDTCAVLPIPNLITPCNVWLFSLWQFAVLFGMLIVAVTIAVLASIVFGENSMTQWVGPAVYWGMLLWGYFGLPNMHNANDNTSGVITALEIARTMPDNQRGKVAFILFDLEEMGLIGSASYRKAHGPQVARQLVFNLDCVGDGDNLMLFPTKNLKKNPGKMTELYRACGYFGKKSLLLREKGFAFYPSDQMNFPYGVGICALRKGKLGLYLSRIHTSKDTILDETNINILRAALTSFICCSAVTFGKEE